MKKLFVFLMIAVILVQSLAVTTFASNEEDISIYSATYDYIYSVNGEYYSVYNNRQYALVDSDNVQHFVANGDGMGAYSEGFVSIYDSNAHTITFTKLDGYSFVLEAMRNSGEFLGGKCSVINVDGAYGLVDTTGHYILECEYEDIIYDATDVFFVYKDDSWSVASLNDGKVTLAPFVNKAVVSFAKDSTLQNIIAFDGEKYGIISVSNKQLVEFKYDYIYDLTNGVYAGKNGTVIELILADGSVTASFEATILGECSEGKIPCYIDGTFCYINKDGKKVNEVTIANTQAIGSYYEGVAVIQMKDGSYSYLSENGDFATTYVWDYAARFARGYALVMDVIPSETDSSEYIRSWKIIDHNFNTVEQLNVEVYVNEAENHTTDFTNGFIRTIDNSTDKMGFAYTSNTYPTYDCQSNGHVKGEWITDKEAEVGISGVKHISCIKCGIVMETATIDPLSDGPETGDNGTQGGTSDTPDTPDTPEPPPDEKDFIDKIADAIGITSEKLLMYAGGFVAAIVLIVVFVAVKRKRR